MPIATSLLRLVYQSHATPRFNGAALETLLCKARHYNQAYHLTGLLLCVEDQFLQVIEGPEPALSRLYGLIKQDPRHHDIQMLAYEPITARAFPDWRMGYASVSAAALRRATGFLPLAQSPGLAAHPPAELWELLRDFAQGVVVDS